MTSKPALLHIGTPKTGSTSIQECLARAELDGSLGRVRYPLWKSDRHHLRLAPLYRPYSDLPPWWRHAYPENDRRFQRMRRQFRDFFFAQLRDASGAIISAEGLGGFAPDLVARLRRDLESLGFDHFYIVLYIRDPADYFLSRTQQRLKTASEPEFVEDPVCFRYEFRQAAETWERIFPGRLIVRRFPDRDGHDVIEDFAELLERHMNITLPTRPVRMNTTLSAEGMQILQDYRQTFWPDNGGFLTTDGTWLVRFLEQSHELVSQTRPALKSEIADKIRANHRADIEVINTQYGVGLQPPNNPAGNIRSGLYNRVDQIVESIDPQIVYQLLMHLARAELGRRPAKRLLPVRLAARAYRMVPPEQRPERLADWVRSRVDR